MMDLGEEAEQFGVDPVRDDLEVLRAVLELDLVHIDDQEMTVIFLNPILIALVKAGTLL